MQNKQRSCKGGGLRASAWSFFCNIHPILMFDEKVKKVWQDLQIKIGAEKIFPSISYSNLDQDTTIVILQCLDALMRLVSPSYSHKAWSRYFQFTKFLGNKKNRAFAVKDRRFGPCPRHVWLGYIILIISSIIWTKTQIAGISWPVSAEECETSKRF